MECQFNAWIDGQHIICEISVSDDISQPVFCFSMMAPGRVVKGGSLIKAVGGYCEILLSDFVAGETKTVVIAHANQRYWPRNRAWLPLGGYIRHAGGNEILPKLNNGVEIGTPAESGEVEGLCLVPAPTSWVPEGSTIKVDGFSSEAPEFDGVTALADRCNFPPFIRQDGLQVTLEQDHDLPAEAYRLHISPSGIVLQHGDEKGAQHGAITLLVLRENYEGDIPCGTIEDAPRFEYRGQHLDCARHFYDPKTLHRLLDLMALLKLNVFHWHFSDDEAFRLEVDCLPDIWKKTAYRGEGELVPGVFGGGVRSGGSYSKSDVAKLIDHGESLGIQILPEVEVPAHALAIVKAMPGLRDDGDNGGEVSVQGYAQNVMNPARPATWDLLEALVSEVSAMFPMGCLHLGCDELPEETWEGSPSIDALKEREGLSTRDDVQEWTMRRLAGYLANKGIKSAAWEEAARGQHGGIGHNALLFSWTEQGPGVEAARVGYDVIMCPAQNVYLDMAHTDHVDDWGAAWAGIISLGDTIDWQVVPEADISERVKGVEGTFWSEFTTQDKEMEPMLAPRILGVATMAWSQEGAVSKQDLYATAGRYLDLFETIGWSSNNPV